MLKLLCILTLVLSGCSSLPIRQLPSDNHNDRIRYLIIHYTTIDYQDSVKALTEPHGVSAHYLIPESNDASYPYSDIQPVQLVDEAKRAWHAGLSYWQGQTNLNDQSIGIELVYKAPCNQREFEPKDSQSQLPKRRLASQGLNIGANSNRICFYPEFDEKQIETLITLIKDILKRNPEISVDHIIGHADITPDRRIDPGPKFPWLRLYKEGIGAWYDEQTVTHYWNQFKDHTPSISLIQSALRAYGYGVMETGILDPSTINAITVFQMHFRPWQVDGKPSEEMAATLFALIEKYRESHLERLIQQYQLEINPVPELPVTFKGQFNGEFPQLNPSSRELVNNRAIFQGKSGEGKLLLTSHGAKSVEIAVNGKKIKNTHRLKDQQTKSYSIAKLVGNGTNTFKISNLLPEGASVTVEIPFPELDKGNPKTEGFSVKKLTKIDHLINKDIEAGFPGATLLVARHGKIIKNTAYGFSSRYNNRGEPLAKPEKMTPDTLFDMASNTKMFATNYAVMKLVSEHKLDVNLPINHYLPEYQHQGRESRIVKDLLTHSAGYPPVVDFHDENNEFGKVFFSHNKALTQELLLTKVPFVRGRGIKSVYSDVDYMLLGTLIERIVGVPLDEYVEKEICQPLGLTHSMFNPLQKNQSIHSIAATELAGNTRQSTIQFDGVRTDVIRGEVHDEKAFYSMQGVSGHAGLFSNTHDMAVLSSVILNRGGYGDVRLFDPSVMDQFLKPSDLDITMGLGWRRAGNGERAWQFGPYASPYAIGHTGWTGTVTIIDPYYDLVIILLTNKKHSKMLLDEDENLVFSGDTFETGKYGSIISLVYEAFLEN